MVLRTFVFVGAQIVRGSSSGPGAIRQATGAKSLPHGRQSSMPAGLSRGPPSHLVAFNVSQAASTPTPALIASTRKSLIRGCRPGTQTHPTQHEDPEVLDIVGCARQRSKRRRHERQYGNADE